MDSILDGKFRMSKVIGRCDWG